MTVLILHAPPTRLKPGVPRRRTARRCTARRNV